MGIEFDESEENAAIAAARAADALAELAASARKKETAEVQAGVQAAALAPQ